MSLTPAPSADHRFDRQGLRELMRALARLYGATDLDAARLRAAHLSAVLRLTPLAMGANVGSAALILGVFGPDVPAGLWLWFALLTGCCGLALKGWWAQRSRTREQASPRAMHRATLHAAVLAALWSAMTAGAFPGATVGQQMTIATLVTGMIGAGSFVLSPLPLASLLYTVIFSIGAWAALWRSGEPAYVGMAILIGLYSPMVAAGALAAWRKSSALIRAQAQSERQERLLAVLLQDFEQQAGEALWEVGVDGRLQHHSPRLLELLKLPAPQELVEPVLRIVQRHSPAGAPALREALDSGRPFRDLHLPWSDGSALRHLSISGKRLVDESGQYRGWRGVLADVTEKVERERLLHQLAHSDSLTGLANRFVLRDTLAQALRLRQSVALLSIDLDHFKAVNDSHGHSAGDELLRAVARRLQACVRPGDLVARLGGDEFALLLRAPIGVAEATLLAQRVIERLTEPVDVGPRRLRVGASVGITVGDESELDVDAVLVRADMALYAAKGAGRGRHAVYEAQLGAENHRRQAIEDGLRRALRHGGLALHWQPKVDIRSWRVVGAEALLRWTDPQLGRVGPTEFIAVAEQCGLIDELGSWALHEACRSAAERLPGQTVSVNVSPMQLRDEHFVGHVRDALQRSGLKPSLLELEITESVFIDDVDGAMQKLHTLRDLGLRVALDDFGTGYSSLSYLRRFPFDTLKIDRSFISEILPRNDARAIVQMIANLAATLGVRTVCEGVETADQLAAVTAAGCDLVQGYLVSPPRPLDELLALQRDWHEREVMAPA